MTIRKPIGLVLLAVVLTGLQGCITKAERSRLAELQAFEQELPKFPDFQQARYSDIYKSGTAVASYFYKSSADFESVKQFYRKALLARGWTEEKQEGLFVTDDSPTTFRKGDYKIVLTLDEAFLWKYTIDFCWSD